jgi:hypothetical protein
MLARAVHQRIRPGQHTGDSLRTHDHERLDECRMPTSRRNQLALQDIAREATPDGTDRVLLVTDRGTVACRLHHAAGPDGGQRDAAQHDVAVLWVFGAGGGLGGPAGGLYARLGHQLLGDGITSLEVAYRQPGDLTQCMLDTLLGVAYLGTLGCSRVVLVGHSFGGAVVISAGAMSEQVIAVAALSSQSAGTGAAESLSPRPLFLAHGLDDEILPAACSRDIHARASEPRQLVLYPGCRHGLDQCRDELDRDLSAWIRSVVAIA